MRREASASLAVISSQTAGHVATTTTLPASLNHSHKQYDGVTQEDHHAYILLLLLTVVTAFVSVCMCVIWTETIHAIISFNSVSARLR